MNNIKLFSDSTCDLPKKLLDKLNISIIPLYVVFRDKTFKDGNDINVEGLYEKVDELDILPKTSAPSPIDFYNAFKPYIDKGDSIIYIGLSSKLSSTILNAKIIEDEFQDSDITIIDSKNLSAGIGLLLLKAYELIESGMDKENIVEEIKSLVSKVKTSFIVDDFDFLHKGGRCSSIQSLMGGLLKIKPILKVNDGNIILGQKPRGKKRKAIDLTLQNIYKNKDSIDLNRIIVGESMAIEDSLYIKEQLEKNMNFKEILLIEAGCVISSHCGKNTTGIYYIEK
ncbi:DegV family protein [Senegalia massiliensis]|uniref:DegV family protein n=1 Tax=Senegalia massiliensis TaxID=1720316 RepID=A0A845QTF3_9CLOT|nr:DegV family protein [Senegalia massiliensis]NBI05825.1 DegV family protein [Senegalia massiliensis]